MRFSFSAHALERAATRGIDPNELIRHFWTWKVISIHGKRLIRQGLVHGEFVVVVYEKQRGAYRIVTVY